MKEIVSIFLCGKMYGVDIENIQGIENYTDVIRTGGEPGCLDGFVVIRGSQIPMINLRKNLCFRRCRLRKKPRSSSL